MWALALAALFAPVAASAADTYTLPATGDVTLRSNQPTTVQTGADLQLDPTKRQTLLQFDLSSITAGHYILSAKLRLYVLVPHADATVRAYRATAPWDETTATWSTMSGNYDNNIVGSAAASAGGFIEIDVLTLVRTWRSGTTNHGIMLAQLGGLTTNYGSKENVDPALHAQLVVVATGDPSYSLSKISQVITDPANGATNPKRMPGAVIEYAVTVSSTSPFESDADSVALVEALPAQTALWVGDLGGGGKGPVNFIDGSTNSRLTYTYTSLSSTTDDLGFSNNGGVSYGYVPVADANGFDAAVTHVRIAPKGVFDGTAGNGDPSFTYQFRVRNK